MFIKKVIFFLILFLLLPISVEAQGSLRVGQGRVVWDHDGLNTTGYRIYFRGTSEGYDGARSIVVLEKGCPLDRLNASEGETFLVVTAFNDIGESDYSNEVSYTHKPIEKRQRFTLGSGSQTFTVTP